MCSSDLETHITSSGGGGYVDSRGGGVIFPPVIRSHNITISEFWIRTPTGKEVHVKYPFSVNDGHEFVLLWGACGKAKAGYVYWHNLTTGKSGTFDRQNRHKLYWSSNEKKQGLISFLVPWLLLTLFEAQYLIAGMVTLLAILVNPIISANLAYLRFKGRIKQHPKIIRNSIREFVDRKDVSLKDRKSVV